MNLQTDWVYFWAAVLGTLAVFGTALLLTRTGRGWKGYLLNVVALLIANVMVLLSVGLILNRQNAWYTYVSDLWAQADGQEEVAGDASNLYAQDTASPEPEPTGKPSALPPLPSPGQRVQTFKVPTSVGHQTWDVQVFLPEGYDQNAATTYPVLMALHGYPGTPSVFGPKNRMDIQKYTDSLVRGKKVAPFITVAPNILPGAKDTECVYGPDGHNQLETWLSKDVPEFIHKSLRVKHERTSWATLGYSFGGWCAPMLTLLHPDRFGAAISLSGYFRPQWMTTPPFTRQSKEGQRLDLIEATKKRPKVAVWVQASKADPTVWPTVKEFIDTAPKHGIFVTSVVDDRGGHIWTQWAPRITTAVAWLGQTLPGFRP